MLYGGRMVVVGFTLSEVDGMGYVTGIIDSCGSIRNNRVRINCREHILQNVGELLDKKTIPYRIQYHYLTINQEEGLVLLYSYAPLVCSGKKAALKKIVSRICMGGLEPYPLGQMDDVMWLKGVMDMRGSHIKSGKNEWYTITHTDTDLVTYLGTTLTSLDISYNLYTVERQGRRTLYNTRIYRAQDIKRLLDISTMR
jgi:hypothetical protein